MLKILQSRLEWKYFVSILY